MPNGNGFATKLNGQANSHAAILTMRSCNPATGDIDFMIGPLSDALCRQTVITNDYFVVFLQSGRAQARYDHGEYELQGPCMIFSTPYQPFVLTDSRDITGAVVRFTPDFHSVENDNCREECGNKAFGRARGLSHIELSAEDVYEVSSVIEAMKREMQRPAPMRDLLFAYLKVLMVIGTRVYRDHDGAEAEAHPDHQVLKKLKRLIDTHFRTTKRPSDYASMLFLTTRALNKLVKQHLRKTLTDVIQERVVEEARRELALTDHSVKEVAASIGFEDPYYFSRMFKKLSRVSPEHYRSAVRHLAPVLPAERRHSNSTGVDYKKQGSTSTPVLL